MPETRVLDFVARQQTECRKPVESALSAYWEWLTVLFVVAAVLVVLAHNISLGELNLNQDEGTHANTALFFAHFFRDLPLQHPVQYTYQYYAHSPSLGVVHWPPLAYLVIGALLFFWPSMITAKAGILLFSALALLFFYRLARCFLPIPAALFAIPLLGFMPGLVLFERAVMLEVPCLAFLIAASYFWARFLENPCGKNALFFSLAASAAFLTKQNAVYLPLFCALLMLAWRKAALLAKSSLWIALGGIAVLAGPCYVLMGRINGHTVLADLSEEQTSTAKTFLLYLQAAPHQMGQCLFLAAIIGAILLFRRNRRPFWFAISWIASVYVVMVAIGHKEQRYVIYWLPAFALLVASLLRPAAFRPLRVLQAAVAAIVVAMLGYHAWTFQRPYITGYAEVARGLLQQTRSGFVLVDDPHYDNLIFQLNASDPAQQIYILRKALFVTNWKASIGSAELVHSSADIAQILDRYGIRYILASDEHDPTMFRSQQILRDYLKSGRFRLVKRYPIGGNTHESGDHVLMYENLQAHPIEAKLVQVPMMTISHDIVVPVEGPR